MTSCGGCKHFLRRRQWSDEGLCMAPVPEWAVHLLLEHWGPNVVDTDGDGCDSWQAKEEPPA